MFTCVCLLFSLIHSSLHLFLFLFLFNIMDKEKLEAITDPYHCVIFKFISQLFLERGFIHVEKHCIDILAEVFKCLLVELAQTARTYYELSGRTMPTLGDIVLALANMGISLEGLIEFAFRADRISAVMPTQMGQQKQLNLLQAGTKASHPNYVPNYLPSFPDPHAYVRTPTHKQPVTEYEAIREKAATQKRDIEKALTKFLCKTSDTDSLFETEDNMFPLIACKPQFPSYLAALNPTDQIFDFEELEYHYLVVNRTEDVTSKDDDSDNDDEKAKQTIKPELEIKPNSTTNKAILENPNIDNPYLRAATLPKRAKSQAANLLATIRDSPLSISKESKTEPLNNLYQQHTQRY